MKSSKIEIIKSSKKYFRHLICLFSFILLGIIIWQYKRLHNIPIVTQPVVKVSVSQVKVQNLENRLKLVASVYASENVSIKARIDSQITKINFQDGNKVEEGQVLFELDDRVLKAQYQQQQAILDKDQAEFDRASLKLDRDQKLSKKGFVSSEQLDTSRQTYKSAAANVQASKALVANIKTQLDYTVIRAPISGRVGTIKLTVGNFVKANDNEPLVIINKIQPIKVQAAVPQEYYEDVKRILKTPHEMNMMVFDANGKNLGTGSLEYRDNTLDESTRTLAIRGIFKNMEDNLWPGMFVNSEIVIGVDKNVLTVPLEAVQNGQQGQYIFIIKGDKANKKDINLIRIQDQVAVIEGDVKEGDIIITDGFLLVKEGTVIEPQPQPNRQVDVAIKKS